jgi:hypothetical protein
MRGPRKPPDRPNRAISTPRPGRGGADAVPTPADLTQARAPSKLREARCKDSAKPGSERWGADQDLGVPKQEGVPAWAAASGTILSPSGGCRAGTNRRILCTQRSMGAPATKGSRVLGAGNSSLLRPPAMLIASVAVAVVVLASANMAYASVGTARNPDPAPSPALSLVRPDPYTSNSSAPFASRLPAAAVVHVSTSPSRETTTRATATGRKETARVANRAAVREAAKRRKAKADRLARLAASIFAIPDHPAPRMVALAAHRVGTIRRVPVGVALAVASLVLLSSALLTGVSRAVAR